LLKDIKEETIAAAKQTIWKNFERSIKKKSMSKVEADATMGAFTAH
jgi:3-hydroxyacyl-CoA dehydrogenase